MSDAENEIEALIHPGEDGKFWAEVVGLPGCYAQGDVTSKVLANLRDAHQLCANATGELPAGAVPRPTVLEIAEGATSADLLRALEAAGWIPTGEMSDIHCLVAHPDSPVKLCLPSDPDQVLNTGFRSAISRFLAG